MFRGSWRKLTRPASLFSRNAPTSRNRLWPARLRLELLEDRLAPATLDVTTGALTYTAGNNINNNLTVSLSGGTYTFTDTGETITLSGNATTAGFTGSGTNTVTGPSSAVTASISISLGNGTDSLTLGTFDAAIPSLTATDGGHAGDTATVATGGNGLVATGPVSLTNFDIINVNNAISVTNGGLVGVNLRALTSITTAAAGAITSDTSVSVFTNTGGTINLGANLTGASSVRIGNPTTGATTTTNITNSITVNGGANGVAFAFSDVSVGANDLTVIGDNIGFASSSSGTTLTSTGGNLTLEPFTAGRNIVFSDNTHQSQQPDLSIPTTELNGITGFASITVGSATGTGNLQVLNPITLSSSVNLEQGGTGGSITVDGKVTMTGSTSVLTLLAPLITLNADLASASSLNLTGNVVLGSPSTVTLDLSSGTGGTITVTGSVDDDSSPTALVVNLGTSGNVNFQGGIGTTTPIQSLTIMGGTNFTFSGNVRTNDFVTLTGGTGTTTFNGGSGIMIGGGLTISGQTVVIGGTGASVAGAISVTASLGLTVNASLGSTVSVSLSGSPITINALVSSAGTVTLTDTGTMGVSETGSGAVSATNLLVMDGGSSSGPFQLTGNNATGVLAGSVHNTLTLNDTVTMAVGKVGSTTGLNTNGNNVVLLDTTHQILLGDGTSTAESLTAANAGVFLVAAGVAEAGNGTVNAFGLSLQGVNTFDLSLGTNDVNTLAANIFGNLLFTSSMPLIVGGVSGLNGVNTNDGNITMTATAFLALGDGTSTAQNLSAGAGTVDLNTAGLFENANATIVAANLRLQGTVGFELNQANQVRVLAAGVSAPVSYRNAGALTVGDVLASRGFASNGNNVSLVCDSLLTLGDGSQNAENVQAGVGNVFLDAAGVTENTNSNMTAFVLTLAGTGSFALPQNNQLNVLVANVTGSVNVFNSQGLIVAGVNSNGGDISLTTNNGLLALGDGTGNAQDIVATSLAAPATVNLSGPGIFENTNAAITADRLIVGGSVGATLDQNNLVATLAVNTTGPVSFTNNQALTVGTVSTINGISVMGNLTLHVSGILTLGDGTSTAQNVAAASVDLTAAGVNQASNSIIDTGTLSLQGTGTFNLSGSNIVNTLAANVNGALTYTNTGIQGLVVGTANGISGVSTNNANLTFNVSGGLLAVGDNTSGAQNINAGSGTVDMTTMGLFENSNGAIVATSLRIVGAVGVMATGANRVGTLAASVTGTFAFADSQLLTVGTVLGTIGVTTTVGDITLIADSMSLTSGIFGGKANGNSTLTLEPLTPSTNITLGGTGTGLNLSTTDLGMITASFTTIVIGATNGTGSIDVPSAVFLPSNVVLRTSGTVTGISNITVPQGDTVTTQP